MSQKKINLGKKNGKWAGNKVGYKGLHSWVRRNLKKPEDGKCQICHISPIYEVINSDDSYTRDLRKWKWSCRRCHQISDGRIFNLKQYQGKSKKELRLIFAR